MTIDLEAYMDGTSPLEGGPAVPPPTFPKTCNACGRVFTREEWDTLEFCRGGFSGDEEVTLEYRQCPGPVASALGCGNTLVIEHLRRKGVPRWAGICDRDPK